MQAQQVQQAQQQQAQQAQQQQAQQQQQEHLRQRQQQRQRQQHRQQLQQQQQQVPAQQVVRFDRLLRASPQLERTFATSPANLRRLAATDLSGSCVSLLSLGTLAFALRYAARMSSPELQQLIPPNPVVQRGLLFLLFLCAAHVAVLVWCPDVYASWRLRLALAQRLLRIGLLLLPVRERKGDAITVLVLLQQQRGGMAHHPNWALLLVYTVFFPLMSLQASLLFPLPMPLTLLLQPLATAACGALVFNSPRAMARVPGMPELAQAACLRIRGAVELVLHVAFDHVAQPGVPGPRLDAWGVPHSCGGPLVASTTLLVFANLLLSCVALAVPHAVELRAKRAFFTRHGRTCVFAWSPLLPLPEHPGLSHALVLLVWPLALWFAAELLAAVMTPAPLPGA